MNNQANAEDWISHHAHFAPGSEAVHDLASGRRFNYAQFDARISRLAVFLATQHGVGPGDRVAVLSHNDSDVFEIQFACRRLGAIFLPLNWRLAVPELAFICNDASPKALLSGTEFLEPANRVRDECAIPSLIDMDNGKPSQYERGIEAADRRITPPKVDISECWTIMYTSGTTGRPKGAQNTYRMGLFNAMHAGMSVGLTQHSKNLVFLPTFHTGGLNCYANPVFHYGGTNVILRSFDPAYFLQILSDKALGITHALGVPTNFLMMSQEPGFTDADLSHIVSFGVGGAASPVSLLQAYGEKGIKLQQMWGMTETAPLGLVLSGEMALEKLGSSGLPVMHSRLAVWDEDGNELGAGKTGELVINGPTVTPGYWNRPEANRESFTEDGWFHTGDAAMKDDEGYFYIVDRWKDMFISGGENVYPAEVENVIFELDAVLETAVIGVAHEKWGEVGRAYVVVREGANLDENAIVEHCEDNLARYKVPKEVKFIDELPHNATGKVLKHELPRD
jgi:fatty-acyl-CoA synthase